MAERTALTFALIAFAVACVSLALRIDWSLFDVRWQLSLRTVLIFAAVLPPLLAGGVKLWEIYERELMIRERARVQQRIFSQFPTPRPRVVIGPPGVREPAVVSGSSVRPRAKAEPPPLYLVPSRSYYPAYPAGDGEEH